MQIIVKQKKEKYVISPKVYTPSNMARLKVSRENRQEYDNEKRARELSAKMPEGHRDAIAVAVAKMMNVSEGQAKKWLSKKASSHVVLDGKIN